MDGVLVDNMRIHARAYDIFYERHGVGNRQNVLKELSGLGNDEIMQRLFTPERLAELGGSRPRRACWFPRLPTSATSW